jgi:cell wall-associated NlpC family hydrolase
MRKHIVNLAMKLQGVPYIWGGSDPRVGFDCSGFVIWVLQVFDLLPSGDWTAAGLAKSFPKTESPQGGDLAFYGPAEGRESHVMMHLSPELVVGASGGGHTTTTEAEANRLGAKVKVKPVGYRSDYLFSVSVVQD